MWWMAIVSREFRRRLRVLLPVGLISLILPVFFFVQSYRVHVVTQVGVVVKSQVDVRYSPSFSGARAFELEEGLKAKIIRHDGEWTQIRLTKDKSGWVESIAIETI